MLRASRWNISRCAEDPSREGADEFDEMQVIGLAAKKVRENFLKIALTRVIEKPKLQDSLRTQSNYRLCRVSKTLRVHKMRG